MASESFDEQIDGIQDPHLLVRLLLDEGEKLSPLLQEKILSKGSDVITPLINLLNNEAVQMENAPGQGWAPIHAVALLGELKAKEAIQPMLSWLLETNSEDDILHGQLITSLGALGEAAYQPALDAFEKADDDYRMSLCDVLVETGVKSERIFNILLDYLHDRVDYGAMVFGIYGDARAIPHLKQALADWETESVTDNLLANQEVIELCAAIRGLGGQLTSDEEQKLERVLALRKRYNRQIESLFQVDDDDYGDEDKKEPVRNPRRNLGRNDPCWCGSGKKYKKCHWLLDQKNLN